MIELKNVDLFLPSTRRIRTNLASSSELVGGNIVRKRGRDYIHAISNLSLNINEGERIGLIGHNGAGKTSLMRLLCGIYQPTTGHCRINGRVSSLFSATIGLDQTATGYENIRFAAALYNIKKSNVDAMIASVEDFSELGSYLNLPVRTYSSGMKMRLGFAIVTSTSPEVLIIDEVLTTGDKVFAAKAKERVVDFAGRAKVLIIASHSHSLLNLFCVRGIWMRQGAIAMDGKLSDVIAAYEASVKSKSPG